MNANADIPHIENPLCRKVYCGKCGMRMFRRSKVENGVRNYYYYCDTRRRKLNTECNQPYMKEDRLMNCIRSVAEKQLQLLGKWQSEREKGKIQGEDAPKSHRKADRQKYLAQEIVRIKNGKKELYEDMKMGMLQQGDFKRECEVLSRRQIQYEQEIKYLMDDGQGKIGVIDALKNYSEQVFELKADKIPVDLLDILIEKIIVFSPEYIEITYSYSDVAEKWRQEAQAKRISEKKGADNE